MNPSYNNFDFSNSIFWSPDIPWSPLYDKRHDNQSENKSVVVVQDTKQISTHKKDCAMSEGEVVAICVVIEVIVMGLLVSRKLPGAK